MAWIMVAVFALSVTIWYVTLEKTPARLKLITGESGGLYYQVGDILQDIWSEQTGAKLEVLTSSGTIANQKALLNHEADIAILQGLKGFPLSLPFILNWFMSLFEKNLTLEPSAIWKADKS